MTECVVCKGKGQVLQEGFEFVGHTKVITFELKDCSFCMGKGTISGD